MVDVVTWLRLLGGVVLLFANGFFVTTEFALTRVRQFSEEEFRGIVYTPAVVRYLYGDGDEPTVRDGDDGPLRRRDDPDLDLREIAAPPMTVSANTVVSDLIDRFQAEQQELALVFEDGDVVGLVTTTDAFEQITGDLEDPLDVEAT
jgi:IMP dehydrogenase